MDAWPSLCVPVMNAAFARRRDEYMALFERAGAGRVFLCLKRTFSPDAIDREIEALRENLAYLRGKGLEAGCWLQAFGFGNPLPPSDAPYADFARITDMDGRTAGDAFCPADGRFTAFMAGLIARVAVAGARLIMLDDDLCLNIRPGLGCACEEHLRLFSGRIGRPVTRAALRGLVYSPQPSPERRAWLALAGDTLRDFCVSMRRAVDGVDPTISMGFCAGFTSWDMEGADALTLTRLLAGGTRPFLRLSGAPYWLVTRRFPGQSMAHIAEFTRLQAAFCEGQSVDFFTENDSYPRPRCVVDAAYIQLFDFVMTAAGCPRQLKYLFDYTAGPGYETGYLRAHVKGRALTEAAEKAFAGLTLAGVAVHEPMRRLARMTLPERASDASLMRMAAFSSASELLSGLGVPVVYGARGGVAAAFGDAGRTVPLSGYKGYILDAQAAVELGKRGVDTGLTDPVMTHESPAYEYFPAEDERVGLSFFDVTEESLFCRAALKPGARVESTFGGEGAAWPASYRYTNDQGMSFLVLLFRADTVLMGGSLARSYTRQAQVARALSDMGAPPEAMIPGEPGAYLLTARGEGRLSVAVANFSLDDWDDTVLRLNGRYRAVKCEGCAGRLEGDNFVIDHLAPWHGAVLVFEE